MTLVFPNTSVVHTDFFRTSTGRKSPYQLHLHCLDPALLLFLYSHYCICVLCIIHHYRWIGILLRARIQDHFSGLIKIWVFYFKIVWCLYIVENSQSLSYIEGYLEQFSLKKTKREGKFNSIFKSYGILYFWKPVHQSFIKFHNAFYWKQKSNIFTPACHSQSIVLIVPCVFCLCHVINKAMFNNKFIVITKPTHQQVRENILRSYVREAC